MAFPTTVPALARALTERAYNEPTPVQSAVLQAEMAGRDLLVSAQTGSGKTVAYGLAIAATLLDGAETFGPAADPLALIVAPTRELALQVQRELTWLYAHAGARVVSCVGGMDVRQEARQLAQGAHIVVGTPGRLRDHLERARLETAQMRAVVLDEADEMLDLGFREDLEFILDATPAERQTLLFSATIARNIAMLARRYQREAVRIDVTSPEEGHSDIDYRAIRIAPNDIEHGVVNVLRFYEAPAAMVFCATREAVRRLQASLLERGFAVVALSGELSQSERTQALQAMRDGRARVCVATDVAARGIDLPELSLVIHAELPKETETLLHRSGRTGRAGRKGVCVLLVPYTRRRRAEQLLGSAGVEATWAAPPSADEIRALDQQRMMRDPVLAEESSEEDLALARALLAERSAEDVAAALARLYRARLPAPEDLLDNAPPEGPRERRDGARGERWREGSSGDMVWFRINVGRRNNADPRWILPMLCRLGHVTKKEIGAIRIFDRDTKFEIAAHIAPRFAAAARRSGDEQVRIEPADGPTGRGEGPAGERPAGKPAGRPFKPGLRKGGKAGGKPEGKAGPRSPGKDFGNGSGKGPGKTPGDKPAKRKPR